MIKDNALESMHYFDLVILIYEDICGFVVLAFRVVQTYIRTDYDQVTHGNLRAAAPFRQITPESGSPLITYVAKRSPFDTL